MNGASAKIVEVHIFLAVLDILFATGHAVNIIQCPISVEKVRLFVAVKLQEIKSGTQVSRVIKISGQEVHIQGGKIPFSEMGSHLRWVLHIRPSGVLCSGDLPEPEADVVKTEDASHLE